VITPGARLTLSGRADERGPNEYNKSLSERRAQLVKAFLAQQGISAEVLDTQACGDEQNLNVDDVKQLMQQNPNLNDEERKRHVEAPTSRSCQQPARGYYLEHERATSRVVSIHSKWRTAYESKKVL